MQGTLKAMVAVSDYHLLLVFEGIDRYIFRMRGSV
jgi:hypothetical protein